MLIDPIVEELTIRQGATFDYVFVFQTRETPQSPYVPYDLTDHEVKMQIRRKKEDETVICDLGAEGYITIPNGVDGEIRIKIPADVTSEFDFPSAVYDILIVEPNGDVTRLIEGNVAISRRVTR